jgi:hypothetical protein
MNSRTRAAAAEEEKEEEEEWGQVEAAIGEGAAMARGVGRRGVEYVWSY